MLLRLFCRGGAGFLACLLVSLSLPGLAAAAEPETITLSPASTVISLPPGGSQLYNLSVLNDSAKSFSVSISASPYHVSGLDYKPGFSQLPGTTDASAWVKLTRTTMVVPSHQTVVI